MVTTSVHVRENLADFRSDAMDVEVEGAEWAAKRSLDDDYSRYSQGTSDASTSTDGDIFPVTEKGRRRRAYTKQRLVREKTPLASIQ